MDTIDRKILEILKADARTNNSEIGKKVGISRVAVRNRIEKMENAGIIKGYAAIADEKHQPDGVEFIMDITAVPECAKDVVNTIAKDDIVRRIMLKLFLLQYAMMDPDRQKRFLKRVAELN